MNPLIAQLETILSQSPLTLTEVAQRAGYDRITIQRWFNHHSPTLDNFEAVVNTLGYKLELKKDD